MVKTQGLSYSHIGGGTTKRRKILEIISYIRSWKLKKLSFFIENYQNIPFSINISFVKNNSTNIDILNKQTGKETNGG